MALPDILEKLERTIFHRLRRCAVDNGYLPDIDLYDIENTDHNIAKAESIRYENDMADIRSSKGFCVEVFSYSNNQSYGTKKVPRIVVETESFLQGQLGTDSTGQYLQNPDGTWNNLTSVSLLSDFYFNVKLICHTTEQHRVIHGIMVSSIPRRGYIPWYTEDHLLPSNNPLVRFISTFDISFVIEGIMEKVYRYEIPDAHEIDDIITKINVPPIKEIRLVINENNETIIK
jgi:hypothetical protein